MQMTAPRPQTLMLALAHPPQLMVLPQVHQAITNASSLSTTWLRIKERKGKISGHRWINGFIVESLNGNSTGKHRSGHSECCCLTIISCLHCYVRYIRETMEWDRKTFPATPTTVPSMIAPPTSSSLPSAPLSHMQLAATAEGSSMGTFGMMSNILNCL